MTKSQLQKELLEKVKPGTKPSHLKRSRSAGELQRNESSFDNERHIPKAPPLPKSSLTKSSEELKNSPNNPTNPNQALSVILLPKS